MAKRLSFKDGVFASALSFINELTRRLIGIISLVILARVLSPEDFGLVAIALIFVNFVTIASEFGGANYLLSRPSINDDMVYTNWTLNLFIRVSLAGLLAVSAVFVADQYADPRLIPIIFVFALQILLSAFESPGMVYKRKDQELGRATLFAITGRVVVTVVTIAVAVIYETYWALIVGKFLMTIYTVMTSYLIAPMRLRLCFANIHEQWQFCRWILLQSFINFFRSNVDAIYVSTTFDKATLGGYNSMKYYATIPQDVLLNPLIKPTLTQLSQMVTAKEHLLARLEVVWFGTASILACVVGLLYVFSTPIVGFVLGEQWLSYASIFGIFAWFLVVMATNEFCANLFSLFSATRYLTFYSLASIAGYVGMFLTVDFADIDQLAWAKVGVDLVLAALVFGLSVWRFFGARRLLLWCLIAAVPVALFAIALSVLSAFEPASSISAVIGQSALVISLFAMLLSGYLWLTRSHCRSSGFIWTLCYQMVKRAVNGVQHKFS